MGARLRFIGLRRASEPEQLRILKERCAILEQLVAAKDALNNSKEQMLQSQRTLINDQRVMLERNKAEILRQFGRANRAERLAALVPVLKSALECFVPPSSVQMPTPGEQVARRAMKIADDLLAELAREEKGCADAVPGKD